MIKEQFPHDFDKVKQYLKNGGKQGRIHYSEAIELVEIIEELQEEKDRLKADIETERNLNKHYKKFIENIDQQDLDRSLLKAIELYEDEKRLAICKN